MARDIFGVWAFLEASVDRDEDASESCERVILERCLPLVGVWPSPQAIVNSPVGDFWFWIESPRDVQLYSQGRMYQLEVSLWENFKGLMQRGIFQVFTTSKEVESSAPMISLPWSSNLLSGRDKVYVYSDPVRSCSIRIPEQVYPSREERDRFLLDG